jgi:radical SAM protein
VKQPARRDLSDRPFLVYWETTQSCALACRHCRAEAMLACHPNQLDHEQGFVLLNQIAGFGDPLPQLILTGGDPLRRDDIYLLIDEAQRLGIGVSITPSATPTLTADEILRLKVHGIQALGLSLDGSTAQRHEAIRGVEGCFDWTIRASRRAAEVGLPLQVNTLVTTETADDLPAIYELLKTFPVMRWSLFFLIAVGRGKALQEVTPARGEEIMDWVYSVARTAPFLIKTTEAPSYRRVALGHMYASDRQPSELEKASVYNGFGIRDGHGIMFISHTGQIYPSGFLPFRAGNALTDDLVEVYRSSPTFRSLHDPNTFKGRCGECEFRFVCGGSRARAFAHTGDMLQSDPLCSYQPQTGA